MNTRLRFGASPICVPPFWARRFHRSILIVIQDVSYGKDVENGDCSVRCLISIMREPSDRRSPPNIEMGRCDTSDRPSTSDDSRIRTKGSTQERDFDDQPIREEAQMRSVKSILAYMSIALWVAIWFVVSVVYWLLGKQPPSPVKMRVF